MHVTENIRAVNCVNVTFQIRFVSVVKTNQEEKNDNEAINLVVEVVETEMKPKADNIQI